MIVGPDRYRRHSCLAALGSNSPWQAARNVWFARITLNNGNAAKWLDVDTSFRQLFPSLGTCAYISASSFDFYITLGRMKPMATYRPLRRTLVRTLLALISLSLHSALAFAEWTHVDRSTDATLLADKSTIRRAGSNAKMWTLTNFARVKVIKGKKHRSVKTQFEFDCNDEQLRVLALIFYAQADGKGAVTFSMSDVEPWTPVAPETIASQLLMFACSR